MNIVIIAKKQYTVSPSSDKPVLREALKKVKYVAIVADEGYDRIDELCETLDTIEDVTEGHRKHVIIIGDIVGIHEKVLRNEYPQFYFYFINPQ